MLLWAYLICLALTCFEEMTKLLFYAVYDRVPGFHHTKSASPHRVHWETTVLHVKEHGSLAKYKSALKK
jgi:hypothetical protein